MQTFLKFAETVLAQRAEDGIRGIGRERSRYRCHIETAAFATKALNQIGQNDIRDWLRAMAQKDCSDTRGTRKLSRATINRSQALVSAILAAAVERDIIPSNPCTGVKLKKRADESCTKDPWTFLTLVEQAMIASCEEIPYADRIAIRFAVGTGLRQGEQFNLELVDLHVDGDEPHVHVRYGSKGRKPPKSGKTRKVPLFGDGLAAAREQLEYLRSSGTPNPQGLVFPTASGCRRQEGKPLGRSGTLRGYLALVGITRRVRWHDLRHTCATNLVTGVLGRRWSLEEIQPLMGHSSIQITQRYAHVGEDALKRAARETVAPVVAVPVAPPPPAPTLQVEGPKRVRDYLSSLASLAKRVKSYVVRDSAKVEYRAEGAA